MAAKAQKLAIEIDEIDRSIIFIEWVPYQERETLLNDADIGVSLHPIHVETRYSIRTRVLDYIWAKLPVLATQGDITSEWIEQYNIGEVVPPFDVAAVASALNILLQRPKSEWRDSFDPLLTRFRWSNVVEPLRRYCITGSYASDREQRDPQIVFAPTIYNRWSRAVYIWRTEGIRAMIHRSLRYIQWRLSRP
jgi:glycosyltransferase involved in cell wall biosynthesis